MPSSVWLNHMVNYVPTQLTDTEEIQTCLSEARARIELGRWYMLAVCAMSAFCLGRGVLRKNCDIAHHLHVLCIANIIPPLAPAMSGTSGEL